MIHRGHVVIVRTGGFTRCHDRRAERRFRLFFLVDVLILRLVGCFILLPDTAVVKDQADDHTDGDAAQDGGFVKQPVRPEGNAGGDGAENRAGDPERQLDGRPAKDECQDNNGDKPSAA